MTEDTLQCFIICLTIAVVILGAFFGIIKLVERSDEYWKPIVLSCIQNGGTMGPNGVCYGAGK